jgi:hypothetical protein
LAIAAKYFSERPLLADEIRFLDTDPGEELLLNAGCE